MIVNPRRLRPYDQPPRRRRPLIPESAGSAATGFLVAAAVWMAAATGIGLLALGLRTVSGLQLSIPLGLFGLTFEFDAPRAQHAFINATVYGWLSNAGLAAVCFITPRLVGRTLAMEKLVNVALVIWNLSLAGGIGLLYVFDTGPHLPYTSIFWLMDGGLSLALLIVTAAFARTVGTDLLRSYISTWYMGLALLAFLGLTTANLVLSAAPVVFAVPELLTALVSAYIGRAIEAFWLLGMAVAVLYYVVPRATGNPLYSSELAILGWLTWIMLAPLSGLGTLVDTNVPYAITTAGDVAAMLMLVPAALVVINLALTFHGRWTLALGPGTAAFALVSLAFLLATALLQAIGALRLVQARVAGSEWQAGAFVFAALGAYTFAMLALAEHALPRLLRRAWGGGLLSGTALWAGFGGATIAGLGLVGAGLAEGSLVRAAASPEALQAALLPYRGVAASGMGLLALAGLAVLLNLFLMYTSGEPVEYVVAGMPSPAAAGH